MLQRSYRQAQPDLQFPVEQNEILPQFRPSGLLPPRGYTVPSADTNMRLPQMAHSKNIQRICLVNKKNRNTHRIFDSAVPQQCALDLKTWYSFGLCPKGIHEGGTTNGYVDFPLNSGVGDTLAHMSQLLFILQLKAQNKMYIWKANTDNFAIQLNHTDIPQDTYIELQNKDSIRVVQTDGNNSTYIELEYIEA